MTDMGLFDSDTGESLAAVASVDFGRNDQGAGLRVEYTLAKRGMIAQLRVGNHFRIHYFVDERTIDDDAERIGRWFGMDGAGAVRLIRDRQPAVTS